MASEYGDFSIDLPSGGSVNCVHVMRAVCAGCGADIGSVASVGLGFPYMCLLHRECLNFFDFSNRWPHDRPAFMYQADPVGRRNSSPTLQID